MKTRKKIENFIISSSIIKNKKGYVENNCDNLINGISKYLYYDDLISASGNELLCKFNALFSSSALVVNNFAIIKEKIKEFEFLHYKNFNSALFERQFTTGLRGTPPNLDFTIENDNTIIAFESKFLETLIQTKAEFSKSYNVNKLNYLDKFWFDLINQYSNKFFYIDVAQLIKHSIGLINYNNKNKSKKIILVYIYWTPINEISFNEYKQHKNELDDFTNSIKKQNDIEFTSMTYQELWNSYYSCIEINKHFEKVKARYSLTIN